MNKELRRYEQTIKPLMGNKRFKHSVNVAEMCLTLAKKFGADEDKAYTAGILHDCQKEADKALMLSEAEKSGYYIDPVEKDCFKLWHGIAGAYYVKNTLKITDEDILNAIRFHTVGRANMTVVEKIVFLATSPVLQLWEFVISKCTSRTAKLLPPLEFELSPSRKGWPKLHS